MHEDFEESLVDAEIEEVVRCKREERSSRLSREGYSSIADELVDKWTNVRREERED